MARRVPSRTAAISCPLRLRSLRNSLKPDSNIFSIAPALPCPLDTLLYMALRSVPPQKSRSNVLVSRAAALVANILMKMYHQDMRDPNTNNPRINWTMTLALVTRLRMETSDDTFTLFPLILFEKPFEAA